MINEKILYLCNTIWERSISVDVSRTLARRTRGWYVEESYVQIDHVRTWSRDRVALVLWIRRPCRKMKRIIASPRLCTLLDISVHWPLDSDILMPKGSATDPDMYRRYLRLYMHAHVYIHTAFEHQIYIANHSAHLLITEDEPPYASHDTSTKLDRVISDWFCEVTRSLEILVVLIERSFMRTYILDNSKSCEIFDLGNTFTEKSYLSNI